MIRSPEVKQMQLQDYPSFQREVYEKIMEKFTYEGNEPEEKARLRYPEELWEMGVVGEHEQSI